MENSISNTVEMPSNKGFINRTALKYIVIAAMVLDHVAWGFDDRLAPIVCQLFHFVGRLTGPTMAFFLAEGYRYTHDVVKYQKRLGIFALLSWLPFVFFEIGIDGVIKNPAVLVLQGVLYTLFLGITALRVWDSKNIPEDRKRLFIALLCVASIIGDWPIMDVLGPLFLHIYRDNKKKKYILVSLVYSLNLLLVFVAGWYNLGVLLVPLIIIFCYNGKGGKKSAFNKWFFYVFYPLHLVILGILRWYVF